MKFLNLACLAAFAFAEEDESAQAQAPVQVPVFTVINQLTLGNDHKSSFSRAIYCKLEKTLDSFKSQKSS
jgi:hypothetical protein